MADFTTRPSAAGDVTNLAPSRDTNWQNVDETPPNDDTDYNSGKNYDLYNLANHGAEAGVISQIQVFCRSRITSGPADNHYPKIKIGGTEYNGSSNSTGSSYENYNQIWVQNPKTSLPWTWEDIDNLQAGAYITASGANTARLTQVYVVVTYTPAPTSDIKKFAGVLQASLKAVATIINANIKAIAGITN